MEQLNGCSRVYVKCLTVRGEVVRIYNAFEVSLSLSQIMNENCLQFFSQFGIHGFSSAIFLKLKTGGTRQRFFHRVINRGHKRY